MNFFLIDLAFGVISRKTLPKPKPKCFFPLFSSRRFIVLYFKLRFMILFCYFLYLERGMDNESTFFACEYPIVPKPFAENTIFPHWTSFVKNQLFLSV